MYRKLRNHFRNLIEESKSNSERMWSSIKKVLPTNATQELTNLVYKSKSYFTAVDIAAIFNLLHFSNVGHKLGKAFGCVKKVALPQPCNIVTKFDLKPVSIRNLSMINYVILKGTRLLDLII